MTCTRSVALIAVLLWASAVAVAQDLTGTWISNDGATYYVRQIGNTVWWAGMSINDGRLFTNVFRGTRNGALITGDWADMPRGTIANAGTLDVEVVVIGVPPGTPPQGPELRVRSQTGNFGAESWRRGNSTIVADPGANPVRAVTTDNLTGVWRADDGGAYYVRQVGNTLWWVGLSSNDGNGFTNVFRGTISSTLTGRTITGEWAEVPRANAANSGRLTVYMSTIGPPGTTPGPRLQRQSLTGSFRATTWWAAPDFEDVLFTRKLNPVAGIRRVLAILWDPHRPEHPAPPREAVRQLLFGPRPSTSTWFLENSGNRLRVEGAGVLGWYSADKPAEHYWNENPATDPFDSDHDGWLTGHVEKWAEAIRKAAGEFNFPAYDTNHDGTITPDELAILIVIPQRDPDGFVRDVVGREAPSVQPLVVNGVRITRISEWYTGIPLNLGTPTHELTHHLLGTPDMYFDKFPWRYAAGSYSIMDHSYQSTHLDPFIKMKLRWIEPQVAAETADYAIPAIETGRKAVVLYDGRHGPAEYFLIENRWRGSSYDAGVGTAGAGIPADGLAVWHIIEDPNLFDAIRFPAPEPGSGDWGRRAVRLVRANGGTPLDDTRALLGASVFLSDDTSPANLRWLNGEPSGFAIRTLTPPGPEMRVRITIRP